MKRFLHLLQEKELPTFKDMDFRNNMQKVYVSEEEKEKFMEKLNRDVEVSELLLHRSATGRRHHILLKDGSRRLLKQEDMPPFLHHHA